MEISHEDARLVGQSLTTLLAICDEIRPLFDIPELAGREDMEALATRLMAAEPEDGPVLTPTARAIGRLELADHHMFGRGD